MGKQRVPVEERDLTKLPQWAQEHIRALERQRDDVILVLNRTIDQQSPSGIFYDESPCTGENPGPTFKRVYVHASQLNFEHAGVGLRVYLPHHGKHVELQWYAGEWGVVDEVAFVPQGFQCARLVARQHMR